MRFVVAKKPAKFDICKFFSILLSLPLYDGGLIHYVYLFPWPVDWNVLIIAVSTHICKAVCACTMLSGCRIGFCSIWY